MKRKLLEQDLAGTMTQDLKQWHERRSEHMLQQAQKKREAQEASAEAEGNQRIRNLRFNSDFNREQTARYAIDRLTDIGRVMDVTKQFARGDFNKSLGLPTEPAVPTAEPIEPAVPTAERLPDPAVPTAEPVAPMSRRATKQVLSNNPGRRLYENNRSKIIFETVAKILQENK
jgi:hypothetical protein